MEAVLLVKPVRPSTTVAELQWAVSSATELLPQVARDPSAVQLYFSPVFITPDVLLGRKARVQLDPTATLAASQIVDDDIIYLEY